MGIARLGVRGEDGAPCLRVAWASCVRSRGGELLVWERSWVSIGLANHAIGLAQLTSASSACPPPCRPAAAFAMLIVVPIFLALGWVHKWRMGLIGLLIPLVVLLQYTW